MSASNYLLTLLNVLLWIILFYTRLMFVKTHALIVFVFLVMMFSLRINISFLLMLYLCLKLPFFLILMIWLLLMGTSNLDLNKSGEGRFYPFPRLIRHLSLFKLFLHLVIRINKIPCRSTRVSHPSNRYDFSHKYFHATISSIPISSCYSKAVKHDCCVRRW